jgi:T-complex protein 1 subunit epsilon
MREHFAIDPLIGKRQQLLLATQLCRMVLKVQSSMCLTEIKHALMFN